MNGAPGLVHDLFMRQRACCVVMPKSNGSLVAPGIGLRRRRSAGLLAACCVGLGLAWPLAQAGGDDGQRARAAREQGRIVPLEQLIAQVSQIVPGRLLQAELDDDDGLLVYELRWQLADGRRLEIELDARDGRWLKLKGPRLETVFRPAPRDAASGTAKQGTQR